MVSQSLQNIPTGVSNHKTTAVVKPPKVGLNERDKVLMMLEDKVEKIETTLNSGRKREIWFNILYSVIGAIVGSIITLLLTKVFQ